jgi:hypothetical protein
MWPRWKGSAARKCGCAGTASEAKPTQITTDDNQRPSPFTSGRGGASGLAFARTTPRRTTSVSDSLDLASARTSTASTEFTAKPLTSSSERPARRKRKAAPSRPPPPKPPVGAAAGCGWLPFPSPTPRVAALRPGRVRRVRLRSPLPWKQGASCLGSGRRRLRRPGFSYSGDVYRIQGLDGGGGRFTPPQCHFAGPIQLAQVRQAKTDGLQNGQGELIATIYDGTGR